MISLLLAVLTTLATWEPVRPPVLHQGYWVSCMGEERVLEHVVGGKLQWELHLGAGEFFLFDHKDDDEDDHATNLLPAPHMDDLKTFSGGRQWTVPSLHLWISVVRAGEADGCESFFIKVVKQ